MSRPWRGSLSRGDLVVAIDDEDLARVGNCWAKGQLRRGDVLACLRAAGDCFFEFTLLTPQGLCGDGAVEFRGSPRPLGAYELKTRLGRVSEEQLQELSRGGLAQLALAAPFPVPTLARAEAGSLLAETQNGEPPHRASRRI